MAKASTPFAGSRKFNGLAKYRLAFLFFTCILRAPWRFEKMPLICGVDGCRAGWIAVFKDLDAGDAFWHVFATFTQLASRTPAPQVIAVDIPIGLPDRGSRDCDLDARKKLGCRGCCVFPAPVRPVLASKSYQEACRIRFSVEMKKMSSQAWGIVPKIREVDTLLRQNPQMAPKIREVHPEVSFFHMNRHSPLPDGKKTGAGQARRLNLLQPHFGSFVNSALEAGKQPGCANDDILDAFAAMWTAERIVRGTASQIAHPPRVDSFGLSMEIVA
jgi:predicted RNase H-like nuclease